MFETFFTYLASIQLWLTDPNVKNALDILQTLVIISATFFTAWWTYKTFAHKEKIAELRNFIVEIENYKWMLELHCAQVRSTKKFTKKMLQERLKLAAHHNKILMMSKTSLYNRESFRKKVQDIVGSWLLKEKIDKMMQWHPSEEERKRRWKEFNSEYRKVIGMINREVSRYVVWI